MPVPSVSKLPTLVLKLGDVSTEIKAISFP